MQGVAGRDFSVDVRARVLTNDPALNVRLAIAGVGLTLADQSRSREPLARGELVAVLEEFSTPFPGFYLYYPERRQASSALRALVDHLRRARRERRLTRRKSEPGVESTGRGEAKRRSRGPGTGSGLRG
jgi:DNA-binding transcriptional LysR family regulator